MNFRYKCFIYYDIAKITYTNTQIVLRCLLVVCLTFKSQNLWPQIIYLMTMYYKPSAKSMIMDFLYKSYGLKVVMKIKQFITNVSCTM